MGTYSPDERVVVCTSCGAPARGDASATTLSCQQCGASVSCIPRHDDADRQAAAQVSSMAEPQRIAALRGQDGQRLQPPQRIQPLLKGKSLDPQQLPQAQALWADARRHLAQNEDPDAAYGMFFLALLVNEQLVKDEQDAQARAVLETTLDHVRAPQQRQILLGLLSRDAARIGETDAAERWLGLMNPRSEEIHADTAYRAACAYLATRQGNYGQVLQVLGRSIDEIPIGDGEDEECAVLRANAHEQLGDLDTAIAQLDEMMMRPGGVKTVTRIVTAHQVLHLCPKSFAEAQVHVEQYLDEPLKTKSGVRLWRVFVFFPFAILAFVLMGATGGFAAAGPAAPFLFVLVFFGAAFGSPIADWMRRRSLEKKGLRGQARTLEVSNTGTKTGKKHNKKLEVEMKLLVNVPGQRLYTARHRELVPKEQRSLCKPKRTVDVLVAPNDPKKMSVVITSFR